MGVLLALSGLDQTVADNVTVARLWEFELHLDTQEQTHIHEQHGRV